MPQRRALCWIIARGRRGREKSGRVLGAKKRGALWLAQNQIDFLLSLTLQHAGDHEP